MLNVRLHISSNVSRTRPRPSLVAYDELTANVDEKTEEVRHYLRTCIGVEESELARLFLPIASNEAAGNSTEKNTSTNSISASFRVNDSWLIDYSSLLQAPLPRYVKSQDKVVGFFAPKYIPLNYTLPGIELNLSAVSNLPFPEAAGSDSNKVYPYKKLQYKIFAKALLEGSVLLKLKQFSARITPKPQTALTLTNDTAILAGGIAECEKSGACATFSSFATNVTVPRKCLALLEALEKYDCCSAAKMKQLWLKDRSFLFAEFCAWMPVALHGSVKKCWSGLF